MCFLAEIHPMDNILLTLSVTTVSHPVAPCSSIRENFAAHNAPEVNAEHAMLNERTCSVL